MNLIKLNELPEVHIYLVLTLLKARRRGPNIEDLLQSNCKYIVFSDLFYYGRESVSTYDYTVVTFQQFLNMMTDENNR